ncbi:S-layer homology domain-containing protein [Lysinibacillus sp. OF-1]|uniref:S-layer homology domain-containing protein n=1 Tax=Lysinibacillus sp. OF-1 TaxID=2972483 RepID=UPI00232B7602|nr:S-layer homology domain-containing protein [Lysinibacillus sp. OF-1]WCH48379.1 S-layer homology domain-containing protein [Lysinibacillus sp. OF-1]
MAKQNKGRKFFAASATAALVASAIVPVASAAQLNDFDKVSGYAKEAVQALVDSGVIQGDANGNFNPTSTITRAQAATIFANALELEAEGSVDFKDVKADAWYYDAIAATVEYGIFEGVSATEFAPNKQLTRSEAAKILVEAFELEGEADLGQFADASTVKSWAKSYLEIAVANGVIKGSEANGKTNLNPNAAITRQDFAVVFSRTLDTVDATPKVDKIEVVDAKTLNVTLTDGTKETVTLEKALEPNKETEVTFKIKDVEYTAKVTYVVTTATAVKSVSATNLKEITVEFDGKVDKTSAEDVDKYTVDSSIELDSATLLEDGKTVRLAVKEVNGKVLENQKSYKLSVKNVKAGEKTIDATNVAFTPVDNTLPEVAEVKSLGTKAIKVTFSEPIKKASTTNFKLDGKSFFGTVDEGSRELILKPYSSADLSVGKHKLEISGVEDFAGFKALTKEVEFEVAEDKVAPTVKSVSATLEKVTITFSEEVDADTVSKSNIYWMSGSDKKAAGSVKKIAGDVYEFDFSANALPGYEMTLFVEGVKDYSGNQITETQVKVKAEVDQTRPEVTEASINKVDNKKITLKFNKQVKIAVGDTKYFTLTDKDGKVVPLKTVTDETGTGVNKVFTLEAYDELTEGYKLKVVGVRDTTKLQNTMNDVTVTITGKDTVAPKYVSNSANSKTRTIIINFNEEMDLATLADAKNYLVTISGKQQQLPSGTEVTPVQGGKAVRIIFPEYIGNDLVGINDPTKAANVTSFKLLALKDVAGNIVEQFGGNDILPNTAAATLTAYDKNTIENAKLTEKGIVKVRFNQPIGKAVASDFTLTGSGVSIASVETDSSDLVTIKLSGDVGSTGFTNTSLVDLGLTVKTDNKITTTSGNNVTGATVNVKDAVKPQVELAKDQHRLVVDSNKIELPFSENLKADDVANFKYDLVVTNVRTGKVVSPAEYKTTLKSGKANIIEIELTTSTNDEYKVSVKKDASFIGDVAGNKAVSSAEYSTAVGAIDTVAPTVVNVTSTANNGSYKIDDVIPVEITFSEAVVVSGAPTLALNTGANATYASGSGTNKLVFNYTVVTNHTASKLDVTGTTALQLNGGTIKDSSGNNGVLTLVAPGATGSLGANKTIVVDGVKVGNAFTISTTSIAAAGTATIDFAEALADASKTAIETAIKAEISGPASTDVSFSWDANGKLTITNNHAATSLTFTNDVTVTNVADLAGNVTASVAITLK